MTTDQQLYEQWREDYALAYEPNYDEHLEADCRAAFFAGIRAARGAQVVPVETLETEYASCLAQCRDAFPVPDVNTELEVLWVAAMGCPLSVPEYIKAISAAPRPQEAAPVQLPEPAFYADARGYEVSAEWLASDEATSDYREVYTIPRYTEHQVMQLLKRN